jgi:hypothetical protein
MSGQDWKGPRRHTISRYSDRHNRCYLVEDPRIYGNQEERCPRVANEGEQEELSARGGPATRARRSVEPPGVALDHISMM